ncbi:MAG: hypothetical protein ABI877_12545 [Gemmatimonadaceae bacterium]
MALTALGTSGYVGLVRGGPRATTIRAALGTAGTNLIVLMPVIAELLQGARTVAEDRGMLQRLVASIGT